MLLADGTIVSNGTSTESLDAFTDNGSEFDRWQSIEREVWGDGEELTTAPQTKKEQRQQKKQRAVASKAEDRSGGPLLVIFLFGLGFFALLYWILVVQGAASGAADGAAAKFGAPPAVSRVVADVGCAPVQTLLTTDRFIGGEPDIADLLAASQRDLDALAALRTANAETAQLAATLEFRAQLVLATAVQVQDGALTPADLRNQIAPLDEQVNGAMRALTTFTQQNCG